MNGVTIAFDLTITLGVVVTIALAVAAWIRSLVSRLDRHEARISATEQSLTHLPAKQDIHNLQLSMEGMRGELRSMQVGMTAATAHAVRQDAVISRVEQYLLEGSK